MSIVKDIDSRNLAHSEVSQSKNKTISEKEKKKKGNYIISLDGPEIVINICELFKVNLFSFGFFPQRYIVHLFDDPIFMSH